MKAVVYDEAQRFSVRTIPDPLVGPRDVLIRVLVAGVCGTDAHLHLGEFGPSYPLIPGHEFVGEVVQIGSAAGDIRVGSRVVVDNTTACGFCAECRRGRPAFCLHLVAMGVNAPGGFAELAVVPAAKCFPVDDLPPDVAVFAEPLACVIHGLDVLSVRPGSDVLVFGAGPTGLLLAQLLLRNGAARLTVAAPTRSKLDLVARHGADQVVHVDRQDPEAAGRTLQELAPDGFDIVIDATGALAVLQLAVPLTRTGGTIFVYGMTAEHAAWNVPPYEIFRRELTIKGSFAQQYSFDRSLQALRLGIVDTEGMITDRFALDQYGQALSAVARSESIKAVVEPNR
jgi:D-arabinitol dehydrogenase (NADP+)